MMRGHLHRPPRTPHDEPPGVHRRDQSQSRYSSVSNRLSELGTACTEPAAASRRGSLNDVHEPHHEIAVPGWRTLPSGLIVPSSVADRLASARPEIAVPPALALSPAPAAAVQQLPVS